MTNTKSELYEKHPDWVIQQPYRENRLGRGGTQQVLDLSNPEVQEFVFGVVDNLMTAHPEIAYIKWDDNMTLYNYGSTYLPADRQSHLYIDYHRGMDKVLRRIQEKYPRLVMQSCASGGGARQLRRTALLRRVLDQRQHRRPATHLHASGACPEPLSRRR